MHDSITINIHVNNSTTGIIASKSPNNQIYNNRVEGSSSQEIDLLNPVLPDDGVTVNNLVYNNTINKAEKGVVAKRRHDYIVQNTTLSDIKSREYWLSGDSTIRIKAQDFGSAIISHTSSATIISQ